LADVHESMEITRSASALVHRWWQAGTGGSGDERPDAEFLPLSVEATRVTLHVEVGAHEAEEPVRRGLRDQLERLRDAGEADHRSHE
jgi:hypothetical protein